MPRRTPVYTVFSTLTEAEPYANQQIALITTLRYRIDDHQVSPSSLSERFAAVSTAVTVDCEITARFRRWAGSVLFFGRSPLVILDCKIAKGRLHDWPQAKLSS
jgi:hypothetical protein